MKNFEGREFVLIFDFDEQIKYIENTDIINWEMVLRNKFLSDSFLNKYFEELEPLLYDYRFLTEKFMIKNKDKLDWGNIVKFQVLDYNFIISNRDVISNDMMESIMDNGVSDTRIIELYQSINKNYNMERDVKYGNLGEEFIEKNIDQLLWFNISIHETLSEGFIEKHKDNLNLSNISIKNNLTEKFLKENKKRINSEYLFENGNLSEETINEYLTEYSLKKKNMSNLNEMKFIIKELDVLIKHQQLSEEFILKYREVVSIPNFSRYQVLSEDFILRYKDELDWHRLTKYQVLSEEFIRKNSNKISIIAALENQNVSDKFIEKNIEKISKSSPNKLRVKNMSEKLMMKYVYHIDMKYIIEKVMVSVKFLNWYLKKFKLEFNDEEEVYKKKQQLIFDNIVLNQDISENFINKNITNINFHTLSLNKNIKVKTLKIFKDKLNLNRVINEERTSDDETFLRLYKVFNGDVKKLKENNIKCDKEVNKIIKVLKRNNKTLLDKKYIEKNMSEMKKEVEREERKIEIKSKNRNKKRKEMVKENSMNNNEMIF